MANLEEKLDILMHAYTNYVDAKTNVEKANENTAETQSNGLNLEQHLTDAYRQYTCLVPNCNPSSDDSEALEEALKFCRQQKTASVKSTPEKKDAPVSPGTKVACDSPLFKPVLSDDTMKQNYNLEAEKEVRELSIKDNSPTPEIMIQPPPTNFTQPVIKPPRGQITMVENQGKTYTRIGPPSVDPRQAFAPSRHSAFRPALPLDGKRLRLDPGMQYLQVDACKNKLSRSTSVPVYPEGEENTPPHRVLFRTGSFVSNLTKQKLKNSILARTSAALVRKPSITDQEMRQIRSKEVDDDSDSSQSEDEEDFEEEPVVARKRKYSGEETAPANDHSVILPPSFPIVMTTSGPS